MELRGFRVQFENLHLEKKHVTLWIEVFKDGVPLDLNATADILPSDERKLLEVSLESVRGFLTGAIRMVLASLPEGEMRPLVPIGGGN